MNIWALIPARYDSVRLAGKPLIKLAGKPMIQHVFERVSKAVDNVMVVTDDERIMKAVEDFGGLAVLTPSHLKTGTDRIAYAVEFEQVFSKESPDLILNVQGDEPLIDPNDLKKLIEGMQACMTVMGTLIYPLQSVNELNDPNIVKAVIDNAGRALYFSRSPIPHHENNLELRKGWRHLGVYIFKTNFLQRYRYLPKSELAEMEQLEQLRVLDSGFQIQCIEANNVSVGVDTPEDVTKVEMLMMRANV